jgi:hypothetical protein
MGMKEAYQEKADLQLQEWREWIERLRANPGDFGARRPSDHQRAYQRLDDCYRIARVRLDELRSTKEERWEFAKQAVERAMIDLKRAIDESGTAHAGKFLQLNTSRAHMYEPFHQKKG